MHEPKPIGSLSPSLLARKGAARPAMRRQFQTHFNDSLARAAVEDDLGWNDLGEDQEAPAVVESAAVETIQPVADVVPIYRALETAEPEAYEALEPAYEEELEEPAEVQPYSASVTFITKPDAFRQQDDIAERFTRAASSELPEFTQHTDFSAEPFNGTEVAEFPQVLRKKDPEVLRQKESADRFAKSDASDMPRPGFLRRSALALGRKAAFTLRLDEARHLKLRLACTVANRSAQQVVTDALDRMLSEMPEIDAMAVHVENKREH